DKAALVGCGVTTGWGAAVNAADVQAGETVVVIGLGGIGMNAVQGAAMAGARHVLAVDPVEWKREKAAVCGATHTAASIEDATGALIGPGMGLCSECVRGVGDSVAPVSQEVVMLDRFDLAMQRKELVGCIFGNANPRRDIPRLLRLNDEGKLKLDELVTNTYTLDQVNQGYRDMRDGKNIRGMIKY